MTDTTCHNKPSSIVCVAADNMNRWNDSRKCQTSTASPAEPGELSIEISRFFSDMQCICRYGL